MQHIKTRTVTGIYSTDTSTSKGNARNKTTGILVDSGCTAHIFKHKEFFTSWNESFQHGSIEIVLADGSVSRNVIKGRGNVAFNVCNSEGSSMKMIMKDALYMPTCEYTGIYSVKKGVDSGDSIAFSREAAYLETPNGQKIPFIHRGNLHFLNSVRVKPKTSRTALEWHYILGHLNFKAIHKMPKMVTGMTITHAHRRACLPCIRGKSKQQYSKVPDERAQYPFQFIHTDICGPFDTEDTLGGFKYVLIFVCDFSNFIQVYNLTHKSAATKALKRFLAFTRRFAPNDAKYGAVKRIRSDNAGEYVGHEWQDVCLAEMIHHETSPPYCPWCNGTAERAFGTLTPKVRTMLEATAAPTYLWPQAYKYAAYTYNRCPVDRIGCTPFAKVYGKMPHVHRLEVFGSQVEALLHQPHTKLSPRTTPGRFVGFDDKCDAPLVYLDENGQIRPFDRIFTVNSPEEDGTKPTTPKDLSFLDVVESYKHCYKCTKEDLPGASLNNPCTAGNLDRPESVLTPSRGSTTDEAGIGQQTKKMYVSQHDKDNDNDDENNDIFNYNSNFNDVNNVLDNKNDFNVYNNHRPKRQRKPPERYGLPINVNDDDYNNFYENIKINNFRVKCYGVTSIPDNYNQAINSHEKERWLQAMDEEWQSLITHETFTYVNRPNDKTIIPSRWVYTVKNEVDGSIRYKARWVGKGFAQTWGVNYHDTYAPMSRMTTIRIMMQLTIQNGYIAHQLDISTAYLNAELDCEIYIEPPKGYCQDDSQVCKLNKSLYGLKQSAKLWNDVLNTFMMSLKFNRSRSDLCLYTKSESAGLTFVIVWVDDIIVIGSNLNLVNQFKNSIKAKFKVKDHLQLKYFLGIEFQFTEGSVRMSQNEYCKSILERFSMTNCNPQDTPCVSNVFDELRSHINSPLLENPTPFRALVGSLLYLQQVTRPDISFITNVLGRQMSKPTDFHMQLGMKVLKYLKGTTDFSLNYTKAPRMDLIGMCDADYANDLDRKSMSGYIFTLARNNSPISWTSRKQKTVASSTCHAEYIALDRAVKECIYLQTLLRDIRIEGLHHTPANIFCDNASTLSLAKNPVTHDATKHIDTKLHYMRDILKNGYLTIEHIPSKQNMADGFTKSLPRPAFREYTKTLKNAQH